MPPAAIDALFVSTCTGYLCPGISSHLAEQAGMRPDVGKGYRPIGLYRRPDEDLILKAVASKGDNFLLNLPDHREMLRRLGLQ